MSFSHVLKKLLDEKNMRGADLARKTGLSEAIISMYLNGKQEPRGKQGIAIAKALDVPLDTLWETEFQAQAEEEWELRKYMEELRTRPEMRMLFKVSKNATKEEIEKVVQMIEAFKRGD